jgi:hypothetical protein
MRKVRVVSDSDKPGRAEKGARRCASRGSELSFGVPSIQAFKEIGVPFSEDAPVLFARLKDVHSLDRKIRVRGVVYQPIGEHTVETENCVPCFPYTVVPTIDNWLLYQPSPRDLVKVQELLCKVGAETFLHCERPHTRRIPIVVQHIVTIISGGRS